MRITLANLAEATAQQVFNQVADHLLTQNKKSIGHHSGVCEYRNSEGLACAAGCLMSDEQVEALGNHYNTAGWSKLVHTKKVPNVHLVLISELQSIHDTHLIEDWEPLLASLAVSMHLDFVVRVKL